MLRDAGQTQLDRCVIDLCLDRPWIRRALQTRPDSLNVSQFVSIYNKMERSDRLRIFGRIRENFLTALIAIEKNESANSYAVASCDLANRCLRSVEDSAIVNLLEPLWHKALQSDNDNLQRNAAHGLAEFAPLKAAHDLTEALVGGASAEDILPSLIRAQSAHAPLRALEVLYHPECPPNLNGWIYATDHALKNAFQTNAAGAITALPKLSMAWSKSVRQVIGKLLDVPEYLQFGPEMTAITHHLKLGNAAPIANRRDTPWRRYLAKSVENGAVSTHYLEFAAPIGTDIPRALVKYRNAFARVVSEATGVQKLRPEHRVPREINQAVDDHFHGVTPILDLQWNTPSRNDIGEFLQLGEFDKFAVVCRSDRFGEFVRETDAVEVVVNAAIKEARDNSSDYGDRSIRLSKLIDLHNDQTITLVTQDSSALNDLVDRGVLDQASADVPRSRLGGTSAGKLAVDILSTMLSSDRPMIGLIEWNPLRSISSDPDTFFEQARLWSRLEAALREERVGFKFFRGQLDSPLGAGYFSPNDDEEYKEAVFLAARDAFTRVDKNRRSWNTAIKSFAKMSLVQLAPVDAVFPPSASGRQNVVSISGAEQQHPRRAKSQ